MKKKKTTIPGIIKWVIALILVVMQVYPFFYVFTSSFKSLDDFRQLPAYALPSKWVLTNFINVFTKSHMLTYFKNSIIVLIGVLIPLLLFALMAGFALSKIKFKGSHDLADLNRHHDSFVWFRDFPGTSLSQILYYLSSYGMGSIFYWYSRIKDQRKGFLYI